MNADDRKSSPAPSRIVIQKEKSVIQVNQHFTVSPVHSFILFIDKWNKYRVTLTNKKKTRGKSTPLAKKQEKYQKGLHSWMNFP